MRPHRPPPPRRIDHQPDRLLEAHTGRGPGPSRPCGSLTDAIWTVGCF